MENFLEKQIMGMFMRRSITKRISDFRQILEYNRN